MSENETKTPATETPKKKYTKHDSSQATLEGFVKAWQSAASVEEAMTSLGASHAELYRLRGVCIKLGIELKRMPRGRKAATIDVEALKALIAGK
jgi:hypothetical protein